MMTSICVRREYGYCKISWTGPTFSWSDKVTINKYQDHHLLFFFTIVSLATIFFTPHLQATALKTSSGKGDLQCSATNAGDWVGFIGLLRYDIFCIIWYLTKTSISLYSKPVTSVTILLIWPKSWDQHQVIIPGIIPDHLHHLIKMMGSSSQVIIPGIGRRCRYAWPATAEETAVRPFGLIVHSDNTEVTIAITSIIGSVKDVDRNPSKENATFHFF